jgi:two-component sensor histidine kinase
MPGHASRFSIGGPPLACGERALNGFALVFQELATNALKYGALTTEYGSIDIRWIQDEHTVTFQWREENGPVVLGAPQVSGFGSKLLRETVENQFRGSLSHCWDPHGLSVQIEIPLEKLAQ